MDQLLKALTGPWAVLLAFVVGILSRWAILLLDRWVGYGPEKNLLAGELADLARHYEANAVVLFAAIDRLRASLAASSPGTAPAPYMAPSIMHFEKLKVQPDALILNSQTFRHVPRKYARVLSHVRVRFRNRNIEAQRLIDHLTSGHFDPPVFLALMEYAVEETALAIKTAREAVAVLEGKATTLSPNPKRDLVYEAVATGS